MQSPPAEWAVLVGSLAAIDYLRSRGEADGDTASEVLRGYVYRHRLGPIVFSLVLFGGAELLRRHIIRGQ